MSSGSRSAQWRSAQWRSAHVRYSRARDDAPAYCAALRDVTALTRVKGVFKTLIGPARKGNFIETTTRLPGWADCVLYGTRTYSCNSEPLASEAAVQRASARIRAKIVHCLGDQWEIDETRGSQGYAVLRDAAGLASITISLDQTGDSRHLVHLDPLHPRAVRCGFSVRTDRPYSPLYLLYAARCARGIGDGFAVVILPAYLSAIGFNPVEIGFVATASLLGTALLTLLIEFVAPRHDIRTMLMLGAGLMAATGAFLPGFGIPALDCLRRVFRNDKSFDRRHRGAGPARARLPRP